ncbi:MAG: alpha-E domain-containing protein [Xanthobacteraceae bacterium]|nr:alpha-E domain-containing protein [Xanthobacteraceae bacterium]
MLSRTAESLFWLARYVERAEYLARTIEATLRATSLPDAYVGKTNEWESALLTAGIDNSFYSHYEEANEKNVIEFLSFSRENPSSIRNCIENARLNSRAVRTALTGAMWDVINSAWIDLQRVWQNGLSSRDAITEFLRFVQEISLRFDGSAYRTMLRNDAYWFSRLGLHLERADNTARILDVKYHLLLPQEEHIGGPLDYYQWTSILRSVSALTAYHWVYRETLKPWLVADLLILNEALPRSLASCYGNLVQNLDRIGVAYGRQGPAQRHARGIRNRLEHSQMDDIFQRGLHEFIQEFVADNNRLSDIISKQYLLPN